MTEEEKEDQQQAKWILVFVGGAFALVGCVLAWDGRPSEPERQCICEHHYPAAGWSMSGTKVGPFASGSASQNQGACAVEFCRVVTCRKPRWALASNCTYVAPERNWMDNPDPFGPELPERVRLGAAHKCSGCPIMSVSK